VLHAPIIRGAPGRSVALVNRSRLTSAITLCRREVVSRNRGKIMFPSAEEIPSMVSKANIRPGTSPDGWI